MVFTYRHRPMKTLYMIVGAIWLLIRMPYWVLRNLLPAWRPRRNWSLLRCFTVEVMDSAVAILLETALPANDTLETMAKTAEKTGFVWVDPIPNELIVGDIKEFAEMNDVKTERIGGFWYGPRATNNTFGQTASPGEKVFYLIHGGGFVLGSASPSFGASRSTSEGLLKHCTDVSRLFAVEYRLAQSPPLPIVNPFPACFLDCLAGYHYLVHKLRFDPKNIIVVGDSCGGVLAYQVARYATTYDGNELVTGAIPNPGALFSGSSMFTNMRSDYTKSWFKARYSVLSLLGKAIPESELDRPWLSPGSSMFRDDDPDIKGVFTSFPSTMIVVGEAEMGRDSMRLLNERMTKEMGNDKVVYLEVDDAPHDFTAGNIWEPQRTIALKAISQWTPTISV